MLQSQESADGMLAQSTVPRRQSVSSHGSPIPPGSPILEEEPSADQYKICSYRPMVNPSINSLGMNSAAFNSFPTTPHQSTPLSMPCGVGYPSPHPATMCHTSPIYTAQDTMCPSGTTPPLGLPMWK